MGISLVQGDTGPQIKATITRSDTGAAEDLTNATIKLNFRKKDATAVLFSLSNQSTGENLTNGICYFIFATGQLDLDAGYYEGEVEVVSSSGTRETIYEIIDFYLREDIA